MIRQLIESYNPILRKVASPVIFPGDSEVNPVDLYNDLAHTMIEHKGLGLAAPQIGVNCRAFVMTAENVIGCFNPIIVDSSKETIYLVEGCLSYPGLFIKVKRPKKIRARYTLPNGETVTNVFDGMSARIFQHELDHLNGVLMMTRANSVHLEKGKKLAKKIERKKKNG